MIYLVKEFRRLKGEENERLKLHRDGFSLGRGAAEGRDAEGNAFQADGGRREV
jgi:hypothetical protein